MSLFSPMQNYYTYNLMAAQQRPVANVTVDNRNAGGIYEGLGDDFLDPDKILRDINNFSGSISPVTSSTWTRLVTPGSPFAKHADSAQISNATNRTINRILNTDYLSRARVTVPVLPGNSIQPIPDLGANPDPTRILLSTLFFTDGIQSGGMPSVGNWWQSPSSMDILWSTLQAQDNIMGGFGYPFMPYNPAPMSFMA